MQDIKSKPFVFVLMPFSDEFKDIYEVGIKPACRDAGAHCERVDEQRFTESILQRIYDQIAKADIIVADMTARNPNVFYEVGFAHALNKHTILLTQKSEDIPFDLKHYRHIVYGGKISELKSQLQKELRFFIRKLRQESGTREIPQLDEVLKRARLVPSQSLAVHVSRLSHYDTSPLSAIDGAILLWNAPSFELFAPDKVWIANRNDHVVPEVFQRASRISGLSVKYIEMHRNRPKYFISDIKYPESDMTEGRLRVELGHSNYRMTMQLSEALNRPIDDQGLTLREWYERGKLSYRYDLPNMIVAKIIVISAAAADKSRQVLFVKRSHQSDFYPNHWTIGVDEQMQGTPMSSDEGGYSDPKFHADADFFATAKRGLHEELRILESDIESIGFLALFREYENYNVNMLFVCHTSIAPPALHSRLLDAADSIETREHEWRDATAEELVSLLAHQDYVPKDSRLGAEHWHPDARLRLLLTCFNLFGVERTLKELDAHAG
ncbi:MAG: hypothetical protein HY327_07010 [Chloroflexi bacterium]|nr:hypothetical protein [Chloroflexota bacterium]